jgi:serine/threonine-protein kinase
MKREQPHCNPGCIEQLLDGQLNNDEQSHVESHLEICPACRQRLETSAAEQRYWQEAAVHLSDDALDREAGTSGLTGLDETDGLDAGQRVNVLRIADYFDPTDDPRMLGRFGGYEIVGVIGFGGMGVVLKGFEAALDRYVAIKVLAPHLATSGAARTRFAREARAAAAVLHENIVAIHRVSEANGLPYLVMPYLPGDSLQKRLDDRGPLDLNEILRIGAQIAAGLTAAHAQGLVHRDIKPGNILLDEGVERVTITDFGLARAADDASLTRSGVIAGTPQYMSPEQARGEPLDGRSDLFSLGSVLYAMCAGRPPFRAETAFGVLQRISDPRPTPIREIVPETPEWLCEIIAKLHAKLPAERFQSAGEVAELLGRWLAHVQQPTVIPAPPRTGDRKRRAKRLRRIVAVAGISVIAIGLAVATQLPSPFGRWAGGEGSGDTSVAIHPHPSPLPEGEGTGAIRPHPSPLPEGEGTMAARPHSGPLAAGEETSAATQFLLDEQAISDGCQDVHQRVSQIQREWSQSASPVGSTGWESAAAELQRRLDDLGQRIENNQP